MIFEAAKSRHQILKDIDSMFAKIRRNVYNNTFHRNLEDLVSRFTGIVNVTFVVKSHFNNAGCIPIYSRTIPVGNGMDDNFDAVVEKPSKYIKRIILVFGEKLIKTLKSTELTSVLLHELGHVYAHTSNSWIFVRKILIGATGEVPVLTGIIFKTITVPTAIVLILISRSLTFTEHIEEYNCDKFAIEHGYGDDLMNVIKKLSKIPKRIRFYSKTRELLRLIFITKTHPHSRSRICKIANSMLKEYKDMYPNLKEELNTTVEGLRC